MKKLLFYVFIIVLLSGCTTAFKIAKLDELQEIAEIKNFNSIDFTTYTAKGFFITPEKYMGEYNSIGIVRYEVYPGATYVKTSSIPNPEFGKTTGASAVIFLKEWKVNYISLQEVLGGMYEQCKKMGADALVNFEVKPSAFPYLGISNPTSINGYIISGFAIKRK